MEPIIAKHLRGSKSGQVDWFELGPNEELTIGRDPANKLAFHQEEDDLVGRRHAKIIRQADGFVILDLNSRNGTFVNTERLTGPTVLKPGDVVEFGAGGPRVQFYQGQESLAGPATRVLQSNQPTIRPTRFVSPATPPLADRVAHVTAEVKGDGKESIAMMHLKSSKSGQVDWFELSPNEELTIGRDPANALAFHQEEDVWVGRKHAKIIRQADGFVIIDLNSRNGTFVNTERLTGPTPLKSGDVIEFGMGGPRIQFYQRRALYDGSVTGISRSNQPGLLATDALASTIPTFTGRVSPATVDPMGAQASGSTLSKRAIGVLAVVIFMATIAGVTLYMRESSQSPMTRGNPGTSGLWQALGAHSEFVFFGTTLLIIAALLGLFIFRRED